MSRVDADAMRRYESARDELVDRLAALEDLLEDERRAPLRAVRKHLKRAQFVLAVVGEFSSGKSFLLNALLGKFRYESTPGGERIVGMLATDINPSTATITELEYGERDEAVAIFEDGRKERIPLDGLNRFVTADEKDAPTLVAVKANSPFLQRGFLVADTPGLASINPAHRRATLRFLPTADAVLYLIDTQQPFSEGDASFLGIVRKHIDSIFIVQTKIDLWNEPGGDGRPEWERAYERISRLAAVHAPGTYVYALSARDYVDGLLRGDDDAVERSRFPMFLAALDASLIKRTGRARLARANERAAEAARDEIAQIDRDLGRLALDENALLAARAQMLPELQSLDDYARDARDALLAQSRTERAALEERGRSFCDELEHALAQAFDTTDIARLRDRERLHLVVDRVVAGVTADFARATATGVVEEIESATRGATERLPLRWSLNDSAAAAFGAAAGTSLWSGDAATAVAATIVLEAVGGLAIGLVHDIATRFSAGAPGKYMKRELTADLRAEIFPRLRAESTAFVDRAGARFVHLYDDLAQAVARAALLKRDSDLGSIDRALSAHGAGDAPARGDALKRRRGEIVSTAIGANEIVARFMAHEDEIDPADPGSDAVRAAHAEHSFDPTSYESGLRPTRWRVAVLGALRRGKSSLINAFAGKNVLVDHDAGSARFPVHVRYGEREQAFALRGGEWREIAFDSASKAAAESAVLVLVPWRLPRELVLVHAPAFDSGDPNAEDVNVAVASHASEVLCLFSRQLSERELELYERVAAFGHPMLFAHTIADNEAPNERRNVVELAQEYLRNRGIAAERVFVISSTEYARAHDEGRAPAGWNETDALRSTLESHAETHMARLERLARARTAAPAGATTPAEKQKPGLLSRLFGKGREGTPRRTSG